MKKIIGNVLCFISGIGLNILYLVGGLIHLWTVLIAYMEDGFIGAAITFFLPVVSQFYWFFASIKVSGAFINTYSIIILVYIGLWILFLGALVVSTILIEE